MGNAADATREQPAVRRAKLKPIRYAHSGVGPARRPASTAGAERVLLAERVQRAGGTRLAERIALAGLHCPPEIAHE